LFLVGKGFPEIFPQIHFASVNRACHGADFRQGPWIEGWRTPPGPEGSNGSLPFLVVVP
jgi:hypothetical protein